MRDAFAIVEPVSVEHLLRDIRTAGLTVPAGFRSPAGDDLEDPMGLLAWIVRGETSTFWYRVSGDNLRRVGILDGDFFAIDRSEGFEQSFETKANMRSPRYTTRLADLPVVRA